MQDVVALYTSKNRSKRRARQLGYAPYGFA